MFMKKKEKTFNVNKGGSFDNNAGCYWMHQNVADDPGVWMLSRRAVCVRVAWRAGWRQRYGARSNWICQKRPPVNVVPLLGKAAANDLLYDRWLYLLRCCCCRCWQVTETMQEVGVEVAAGNRFKIFIFILHQLIKKWARS